MVWWVPLAAAAASAVGSMISNERNIEAAEDNRDFQERLSGTAHQREVADLRAAGLNPILSAFGKGASTPAGATPTITDPIGPAVNTAMAARQMQADLDVKRETAANQKAQADSNEQDAIRKARENYSESRFHEAGPDGSMSEWQRGRGGQLQEQRESGAIRTLETQIRSVYATIQERLGVKTAEALLNKYLAEEEGARSRSYRDQLEGFRQFIENQISIGALPGGFTFREFERGLHSARDAAGAFGNIFRKFPR